GALENMKDERERDLPALLAHRLVGWNSNRSPRAASKLAHKTNTGSDSRCCCPRLRREFQRLGVNLPLQGRRGPREKEEASGSEGARLESADVGVERFGLNTGLS